MRAKVPQCHADVINEGASTSGMNSKRRENHPQTGMAKGVWGPQKILGGNTRGKREWIKRCFQFLPNLVKTLTIFPLCQIHKMSASRPKTTKKKMTPQKVIPKSLRPKVCGDPKILEGNRIGKQEWIKRFFHFFQKFGKTLTIFSPLSDSEDECVSSEDDEEVEDDPPESPLKKAKAKGVW